MSDEAAMWLAAFCAAYMQQGIVKDMTLRDECERTGTTPLRLSRRVLIAATWVVEPFQAAARSATSPARGLVAGAMMVSALLAVFTAQFWLAFWVTDLLTDNVLLRILYGGVAVLLISVLSTPLIGLTGYIVLGALDGARTGWSMQRAVMAMRTVPSGQTSERGSSHGSPHSPSMSYLIADDLLRRTPEWVHGSDQTTVIRCLASAWVGLAEVEARQGKAVGHQLVAVEKYFATAPFQRLSVEQRGAWSNLVAGFVEARAAPNAELVPVLESVTKFAFGICVELHARAPDAMGVWLALRACRDRLGVSDEYVE